MTEEKSATPANEPGLPVSHPASTTQDVQDEPSTATSSEAQAGEDPTPSPAEPSTDPENEVGGEDTSGTD